MLYDGIELTDASVATNLAIVSGNDLPTTNLTVGELFYKLNDGLYVYSGAQWVRAGTGSSDAKYDLALSIAGKPAPSVYVLNFVVVNAFSLPAGLTGSFAKSSAAATSNSTFTIYKNGSSIGTILFGAGASAGTITFSAQQTFAPGDLLQIIAPSPQDTTLANIAITLKGTLTA